MHLAPIEAGTATTTKIGVVHESGISARMEPSMRDEDWFILRTSGRHTLRLAESLREDGFTVWTPIEQKRIRIPRANVRRDIVLPLMPSYVFVRANHLIDLIQMAALVFKPRRSAGQPAHADFSVMHFHDRIPMVADRLLQGLRTIEAKRAPRKRAERLPRGLEVRVKIEGGSWAGMHGKVERSNETTTLVCFDNRLMVRMETCMLDLNSLQQERSVAATKRAA